jgi:hypothetical protein
VLEWKLPGLKIRARMKMRPTRGFRARQTARHMRVWQRAQTKASR